MADRDPYDVADEVAELAVEMVLALRDEDPERLHRRLEGIGRREPLLLRQLVVALAAMVPDDMPVSELLGWTVRLMPADRRRRLERQEYDARRYRRLNIVPSTPDGQQEEETA